MRRLSPIILPLLLGQCVDGSTSSPPSVIHSRPLTIASTPVDLDSARPERRDLGALTLIAGWELTSADRAFGGLSAIDVRPDPDGTLVTALSDAGYIVRFRLGRFGHVSRARIISLGNACGAVKARNDNDTESLTHDAGRHHWWIGYEWRNVICKLNGEVEVGEGLVAPVAMAGWERRAGPESLVRLSDGRFLAFSEGRAHHAEGNPVLLFDRDPTAPSAKVTRLFYRPPPGFRPTDAAQLPDGRILVLNRHFGLSSLFTAQLVVLDRSDFRAGTVLQGRVIARFQPPVLADNFEGLSVTVEQGRPIVWIVSDDNYMRWQRTLLLKFALR